MKVKYLAICVQEGGVVQSVAPFDNYDEANNCISRDATKMYNSIVDRLDSEIEVYPGGAVVVDGAEVYIWSIRPLILEKEDGVMLVKNFMYNGLFVQRLGGYAGYTATFKEWTEDPGIAVCKCSDGKERLIPSCCLDEFDKDAYPKQNTDNKVGYWGSPSCS